MRGAGDYRLANQHHGLMLLSRGSVICQPEELANVLSIFLDLFVFMGHVVT